MLGVFRFYLIYKAFSKAGEGIRTLDIQLGKLTLYQLSYTRMPTLSSMKNHLNCTQPLRQTTKLIGEA